MYKPLKKSIFSCPGLRLKTISAIVTATICLSQHLLAQVSDDFSDADITTNPSWNGSTDHFIINTLFQLQLNNLQAGTSWLSTRLPPAPRENMEWDFFIRQSFAPSAANFSRVYLISNQSDLTGPLDGYYLQFGEAGSDDAVELFRQSGENTFSVCKGRVAGIATSFGIGVRVIRAASGLWELYVDYSGGTDYSAEASAMDPSPVTGDYFGILTTYTITNSNRFYFDDISIRSILIPDTSPPEVISVEVASPSELTIVFSETVNPGSARESANYFASPTFGNPATVLLEEDERTVTLRYSSAFRNGNTYFLTIANVADPGGNMMATTTMEFSYFKPVAVQHKDIIITEFCADPTPVMGLPEAEFIEVYNRSENPFDLSGWTLEDLAGAGQLPSVIFLPGEYLILTSSGAAANFNSYGPVLPVGSFRSLNNQGDAIILKDASGFTVDSLQYSVAWYRDKEKAEGGWSLEIIDLQNVCATARNWVASEAETGGTPGKQNSVMASLPDNTGPKLVSVVPTGVMTLLVTFDEKLDNPIPLIEKFSITPPLQITKIAFSDLSLSTLTLSLLHAVEPGKEYQLSVNNIYDCAGNKIQEPFSTMAFVLPQKASPGDIIVNEILFNPRPTGVDFIELYNRSEKTIDLRDWSIGNFREAGITEARRVSEKSFIVRPREYVVLTENANTLKGEYLMGKEEVFSEVDLPGFNDDAGSVAIVDSTGILIGSFQYSDQMHAVFLKDDEGVSLERIAFDVDGHETQNWRSANADAGFATPGYLNSNSRIGVLLNDGSVVVEPEIFQPLVNSRDFTRIKYRFGHGGFVANIRIFDQLGRPIKQLAHNELLGTEGFFRWDGDQDNGARARMGHYMVWFELFDSTGMVKTFRKRVVVY